MYIHAPNIHQGGGRTLLNAFLKVLEYDIVLTVDERMQLPEVMGDNVKVTCIKPSVVQRLLAEKWLVQAVTKDDVVLCFGNLPPLFRLRGRTVVFVQNRYLVEKVPLNNFSLFVRIRLIIERLWFFRKMMNVDEFVVQTPTMKRLVEVRARGKVPVRILPFVYEPNGYSRKMLGQNQTKNNVYDFAYIASGEPHKNHQRLIDAWCLLASEGIFPSLCLTLNQADFNGLCDLIELMHQRYGVKIYNVGGLSHKEVLDLYKKSGAVIYPSNFESFGLPLIEARQAGLAVLASELDFVRDVLDPEQTFDPESAVSIARAVKRFMGEEEKPLPLLNASHFLATVFKKDI